MGGLDFGAWCILELCGRRRYAGRISQEQHFGVWMGRLDIPNKDYFKTIYFGGQSIFMVQPCSERFARKTAATLNVALPWEDADDAPTRAPIPSEPPPFTAGVCGVCDGDQADDRSAYPLDTEPFAEVGRDDDALGNEAGGNEVGRDATGNQTGVEPPSIEDFAFEAGLPLGDGSDDAAQEAEALAALQNDDSGGDSVSDEICGRLTELAEVLEIGERVEDHFKVTRLPLDPPF